MGKSKAEAAAELRPAVEITVEARLGALFDPNDIKWKPQSVKGNRAMAIAYIDARLVMDRLDDVVGAGGWQDIYDLLPGGEVVCTLGVKLNGEWITKQDVGGQSEQPDEGDRVKAAFSDALKRAAVKFGIGRYLYALGTTWHDYDPQARRFTSPPRLPAWATKGFTLTPKAHEAAQDTQAAPSGRPDAQPPAGHRPATQPGPASAPKDGAQLKARLVAKEVAMVQAGLCKDGELTRAVAQALRDAGIVGDVGVAAGETLAVATEKAAEAVRAFESGVRRRQAAAQNGGA